MKEPRKKERQSQKRTKRRTKLSEKTLKEAAFRATGWEFWDSPLTSPALMGWWKVFLGKCDKNGSAAYMGTLRAHPPWGP